MKKSILIADDDPISLRIIGGLVKSLGYKLFTAINGVEVVEMLDSEQIDVVVTDYEMEPMNGLEVLSHIRSNQLKVPVILLTGVGNYELMSEAWANGVFDFLTKPVDAKRLAENIRLALAFGDVEMHNKKLKTTFAEAHASEEDIFKLKDQIVEEALVHSLLQGIGIEAVKDILDDFKLFTLRDILDIKVGYKTNNPDSFKAYAHKVKGACANMGLSRVQAIALALEKAGVSGKNTPTHLAKIEEEFQAGIHELEAVIQNFDRAKGA